MRIRTLLVLAFLIATLVPSAIFGWLSYKNGLEREFADVKEQHLLLAQNVAMALDRYHTDLVGTFDSVSVALLNKQPVPNLEALMSSINLMCVLIVDQSTGQVVARTDVRDGANKMAVTKELLNVAKNAVRAGRTAFSPVLSGPEGNNIILGVRQHGNKLAIAVVSTRYFVEIGKSITFGKKGHAAIVDPVGNILSHPNPDWVKARKNIAAVSAVKRMMDGQTGVEQFYSPALKDDMIAGLTTVKGPGWGVMIPQPVSELYAKVLRDSRGIFAALFIGLVLTAVLVAGLLKSLASPIEQLLTAMKSNIGERKLQRSDVPDGFIPVAEISQFTENYNEMLNHISLANNKLVAMAYRDGVTGLPNRDKLIDLASQMISPDDKSEASGALVFIDLDDFKQINDVYGHDIGDEFLIDCANKLKRVAVSQHAEIELRRGETRSPVVARIGGDEFAMLVPGLVTGDEVDRFLNILCDEMTRPSKELSYIVKRGASIGCSRFPLDGTSLPDLMRFADIAMYHAKKSGKNRAQRYLPENGTMSASELKKQVEIAISANELTLEYQPKISACDQSVTGVEALVRWQHPTFGRLMPNVWISAIHNSPVMNKLGDWVVQTAMKDHKVWTDAGLDLSVAVNVGSQHFSSPKFVERLTDLAKRHDFDPRNMEIEITEDALFVSDAAAGGTICELHKQGFRIAIDDFGTGYSNIARFCELPVDCLKIDRSLMASSNHDKRAADMLACIAMMAQKLDCQTTAEGVETQADVERATKSGIDMLQGFHFSAAMPCDKLVRWIDSWNGQSSGNRAVMTDSQRDGSNVAKLKIVAA